MPFKIRVGVVSIFALGFILPLYAQTSMLDKTFGANGRAVTFIAGGDSTQDEGYAAAIQLDGKIVVAGLSIDSLARDAFAVARFNTNGTLDNTFGSGGTVRTFIAGGDSSDDEGYAVAIQQDGKIVAAGYSKDTVGGVSHFAFALSRYDTNGKLDNAFGSGGTVRTFISGGGLFDEGESIAIQPDGKIVVAGISRPTVYSSGNAIASGYDCGIARFNPDGTLDDTFGRKGSVQVTSIGGIPLLDNSLVLQPDGKIVVAGTSIDNATGYLYFSAARLNQDGSIDTTFGNGGVAAVSISSGNETGDECYGIAVQPDGKIILVGTSYDSTNHGAFGIARLDSDGALDNSFGVGGSERIFIAGADSLTNIAYSAAVQQDGKIVVAGKSGFLGPAFSVVRLNRDGTVDNTFGINGSAYADSFSTDVDVDDEAHAVLVQPDGKIVAAGFSQTTFGPAEFAVARFMHSNVTGIMNNKITPKSFVLYQNYPNPFNPTTKIDFQMSEPGFVTLEVYDVLGRKVTTLVNRRESAGDHVVAFDGSELASGVYYYRLVAGNGLSVKKMILLK